MYEHEFLEYHECMLKHADVRTFFIDHWLRGVRRHLACDGELRVLWPRRRLGSLRTLVPPLRRTKMGLL